MEVEVNVRTESGITLTLLLFGSRSLIKDGEQANLGTYHKIKHFVAVLEKLRIV